MEKPYWEGKHYAFFSNKECEYFPCHAGADPENFNCLFCYCPLYALGDKCGGNFRMTETGIKDCELSAAAQSTELRVRNREIQRAGGTDEEDTRRKRRIMI